MQKRIRHGIQFLGLEVTQSISFKKKEILRNHVHCLTTYIYFTVCRWMLITQSGRYPLVVTHCQRLSRVLRSAVPVKKHGELCKTLMSGYHL